ANDGNGVTINLNYTDGTGTSGGFAAGDKFNGIENVTGTQYDDTFFASAVANKFDGGTSTSASHNRVNYSASNAGVIVDLVLNVGGDAINGTTSYANGDTYLNIQDATGSNFADIFIASAAANRFDGGSGSDTVSYAKANDGVGVTVDLTNGVGTGGFAQGDTYTSIENAIGTNWDDTFIASTDSNFFDGGLGSNTVSYANRGVSVTVDLSTATGTGGGAAAGDTYVNIQNVIGGSGADTLTGYGVVGVKSVLTGGNGGDILAGVQANRAYTYASYAGSGAGVTVDLTSTTGVGTTGGDATGDQLRFIDNLIGSSFSDTFIANDQANSFDGGAGGLDTVSYAASASPVTVDLSTAGFVGVGGYAAGDTYVRISNVIGTGGNDVLTGANSNRSELIGGAGADDLHAATGNVSNTYASYRYSSSGVTVDFVQAKGLAGDALNDTLNNIVNVVGSGSNDLFYASSAANKFEGNGGSDTVDYHYSAAGVTVDLYDGTFTSGGYAQGDTYNAIANVVGTGQNDTFYATAAANSFNGGTGGSDTVNYSHSGVGVKVNLDTGFGSDAVTGVTSFANGDTYTNIQNVVGSSGNDYFIASSAANAFTGGGGNDTVSYESATGSGFTASLTSGTGSGSGSYAAGDTYAGISNLVGSQNVDSHLIGNSGANILTAQGSGTTNILEGMGAGSGTDVYNALLGGSNTLTAGSGTNIFNVSAAGLDGIFNQTTHSSNLVSANGSAGNTTLHFDNLGNTLTLSNFSSKVSGITTLDISTSTNTNVLITTQDIVSLAQTSNHLLTIKMTATESLQITNGSNYKILGTGDYVFYSDAALSNEVARIHIQLAA
ncbi:calcium-binding protein, partial [Herbaspirillum lusitanum]